MDNPAAVLKTIKMAVLYLLILVFPLFFLPFTQEFFATNKMYLLAFGSLSLILISTLEFLVTRKFVWKKTSTDNILYLLLATIGLSILLTSQNKIQALLNPNFGLLAFFSLVVICYYRSRQRPLKITNYILQLSAAILSLITIIFFLQPFKNATLAGNLQFLKNISFSPLGNQVDLVLFLGFFVVFGFVKVLTSKNIRESLADVIFFLINLAGFSVAMYLFIKPGNNIILPPYKLSWYAAVETLKNPLTAFFGVGIDNYSVIFSRVKDILYNQSSLWQVQSFTISRSAILHIFTETGLLGLTAFVLLLVNLLMKLTHKSYQPGTKLSLKPLLISTLYIILALVFFPPSLPLFFLLFVVIARTDSWIINDRQESAYTLDLGSIIPIYLGALIISFVFIGASGYFLARAYAGEYYFKQSLDSYTQNDLRSFYENQRQAIILNPYIERYRINFSQANLLVANNILTTKKRADITDQDRQNISQAINAAINEAKAAVILNGGKAINWINLAEIYRSIIYVAQGADALNWTVSSYQRAMVTDPQNPKYRFDMGTLFYSFNNFDEASRFFEQAVNLKPDWANAHYNLAWTSFYKGDYQTAANEMQSAMFLIDPKKNQADYQKASKDLEEFKKKLPQTETTKVTPTPSQLNLPSPQPTVSLEQKLKLPKEASPEAR